ncbi:sodium:proton antiporter [Phenylobacterium sp.]|jgi:CPA1 family monovalent cation:H+ antiporter|uniref:cation:proton antiporter n=1 Tax=Phenylobacterium sp. TaxID=1871053 RepID=UPI002E3719C3|nr:sodium:proton antiporter [Phenylobacterium sp.]HEX3366263.1 sodium:proton antiporter [Phenylobacterium sp.]
MTLFQIMALFLGLIGLAGWVNARLLHWPSATVMVLAGGLNAGVLLLLHQVFPAGGAGQVIAAVVGVNFPQAVLGYMLGFLLFAGAMQVDLSELHRRRLAVWTLATVGVLASTGIVGGGLWLAARGLGLQLSLPWACVFGALISPTDPIAVLAAVRAGKLSKMLEVVLQGEALFNDAVGIVIFTAALAIAIGGGLHPLDAIGQVALQALGGLAFGLAAGWLALRIIGTIDDYAVEVTLSLALAAGVYALAQALGISGPIAVVAAGLLMGDEGAKTRMSETTRRHMREFWTLIDEILNALLFILLGLEVLVIPFDPRLAGLWGAALVLVLAARFAVVLPWGAYFQVREGQRHAGLVLGWGGLHGALSLAMALSVPRGPAHVLILSTTFAVVIFSIVVQGLTFGKVAAWHAGDPAPASVE